MLRLRWPIVLGLTSVLTILRPAGANLYFDIGLHGRVQTSDTIVLARVVDANRALVRVERVLKGNPPERITLVSYVDGFAGPSCRKPLVLDARELLFLKKKGGDYAPVQDQFGRMIIDGERLIDSFRAEPRGLLQTIASIERLVALQAQATLNDAESEAAYIAALKSADTEVQMWALWNAHHRIKAPSPALIDALLASWPKDVGPVNRGWNAAGLIANAAVTWRIQQAAPFFARILSISANGDERAWAAMSLGGTGNRAYLQILRRVAAEDAYAQARALAYNGIMYMLGPESLADLRLGAKDGNENVRARVIVDAYNLLEVGHPEPRWPPPSRALLAEVRAFLTDMQQDPNRLVAEAARSMLAKLAEYQP